MNSPLWENDPLEIKFEPESVEHFKIENEEMQDMNEEGQENYPSTKNYNEESLSLRVICERIGRKLLAAGKKYCRNCYDIFDNSDELVAHLTSTNGNCCQGYLEQDSNEYDCFQSSTESEEFVSGFYANEASNDSTSSSSTISTATKTRRRKTKETRPTTNTRTASSSNNNNHNNDNNDDDNTNRKVADKLSKCPFCPEIAPTLDIFNSHIRLHTTGTLNAYTCSLCPSSSSSSYGEGLLIGTAHDWFYHVRTSHGENSETNDIPQQYSLNNLSQSTEENDNEKEKQKSVLAACTVPGCKKVYPSTWSFKCHMQVHRGLVKEYSCNHPGCPDADAKKKKKSWKNLEQLQQHMTSHKNQPISQFRRRTTHWLCTVPDCFKNIRGVKSYVKHVLEHQEKKLKCSICHMEFASPHFLNRHEAFHKIVDEIQEDEEEENEEQN